jgi:hypothetical protein
MNIEIDHTEARRLRQVLADTYATAVRMSHHPELAVERQHEFQLTASVCLSVINKITGALHAKAGEV